MKLIKLTAFCLFGPFLLLLGLIAGAVMFTVLWVRWELEGPDE